MKHICLYIIIGVSLLMASCDLHTSDNGELDGFWQLAYVDTLATGGTADMREQQYSWSFQGDLLFVQHASTKVLFRFSHASSSLTLSHPYFSDRDRGDVAVTDVGMLSELGIFRLEEHFRVLQLDGSCMTLENDRLRLHFRRY